jgi:hypothetical protein
MTRVRVRQHRSRLRLAKPLASEIAETRQAVRSGALLKAAVTLAGFSTILYGCGHIILAAHYGFWGLPSKVLWTSAEASEAGGRFLLLDVPLTLIDPILKLRPVAFALLGFAASASVAMRKYPKFFRLPASAGWALALEYPELIALIGLATSAVLVNPVWKAISFSCAAIPTKCALPVSADVLYDGVPWRSVAALALTYVPMQLVRVRPTLMTGSLVALQWLVVATMLLTWPAAFGKFRFQPSYPSLDATTAVGEQASVGVLAPPDVLLLLGAYEKDLVVWNRSRHRIEFQPETNEPLILGPKQDLDLKIVEKNP